MCFVFKHIHIMTITITTIQQKSNYYYLSVDKNESKKIKYIKWIQFSIFIFVKKKKNINDHPN